MLGGKMVNIMYMVIQGDSSLAEVYSISLAHLTITQRHV